MTTSGTAPPASTPPWTSPPARSSARLHARHRAIEFKKFLHHHRPRGPRAPRRASGHGQRLDPQDPGHPALAAGPPPVRRPLHPDLELLAQSGRTLVQRADHQEAPTRRPHQPSAPSTPTSAPGSRPGTRTPAPTSGPRPADQILESIARYCTRINDSGHSSQPWEPMKPKSTVRTPFCDHGSRAPLRQRSHQVARHLDLSAVDAQHHLAADRLADPNGSSPVNVTATYSSASSAEPPASSRAARRRRRRTSPARHPRRGCRRRRAPIARPRDGRRRSRRTGRAGSPRWGP